ncbi:rhomboid-like protein [Kitasatospora sp. NPDC048194]|uniref:rhomboid-like protein n=1 Tax=Kitasatospora sp. NPDC048194 TaxID=3364045 RepID=UPI0037154C49
MAGLRDGAGRNALARAPYGMLRHGLRTGVLEWLVERLPTPRGNPFTLGYLAVVGATTTFAGLADPELVQRLREASSSDGHNLLQHPLRALALSGFWIAGDVWMPYLWGFALTLAPLERRVGSARAAAVFAIGHVTATLLSQGVVIAAVETGRMAPGAMRDLDIGVSYGVLACLGAVSGLLPRPARVLALGGAGLMIAQQIAAEKDVVTAVGHPAAVLAGVALWRWLRGAERRPPRSRPRTASAAGPAPSVPAPAVPTVPAAAPGGARPSAAR